MKPSSGRARSAATLAATAFGGVARGMSRGVALGATRALTLRVTLAVALAPCRPRPPLRRKPPRCRKAPPCATTRRKSTRRSRRKTGSGSLTQLDARIASNPRDAQAKFKRGTVLAHLNRDDEAIDAFTELTQTYPELPEPYNNLAALYAKQGRYDEARAALETATKVNPGYSLAYENLGDLYLRLADEAYRRAQSLGKVSPHHHAAPRGHPEDHLAGQDARPSRTAGRQPAEDDYSARATSNMTQTPSFQFGGANGSLAMPPYMAPSK